MRQSALVCVMVLGLLLAGCMQFLRPSEEATPSRPEELFDRGVSELTAHGETSAFETLYRQYPDSPWTTRARGVVALTALRALGTQEELTWRGQRAARVEEQVSRLLVEVEVLTADVARLQEERDRLQTERSGLSLELDKLRSEGDRLRGELDRVRAEDALQIQDLERLRTDNARLLADLEQLKNLTIEMELKR